MSDGPLRSRENAGQIETQFHPGRGAINLPGKDRITVRAKIANNHRSQKWRFDFAQFKAQTSVTGGALRPESQSGGNHERRKTNDEKRPEQKGRGQND
jgi:hypothetical protein